MCGRPRLPETQSRCCASRVRITWTYGIPHPARSPAFSRRRNPSSSELPDEVDKPCACNWGSLVHASDVRQAGVAGFFQVPQALLRDFEGGAYRGDLDRPARRVVGAQVTLTGI